MTASAKTAPGTVARCIRVRLRAIVHPSRLPTRRSSSAQPAIVPTRFASPYATASPATTWAAGSRDSAVSAAAMPKTMVIRPTNAAVLLSWNE